MNCICGYCRKKFDRNASAVGRAVRGGAKVYCNKSCAGLGRRKNKNDAQKKAEKRLYDIAYREKNSAALKIKKAARFQRDYDPVAAAVKRKETMPRHIGYCRKPEYKKWKKKYDEHYSAKKKFGEFYESFLLLKKIDEEIASRASKYEIGLENGTINKAQTRRRNYERTYSNQS